MSTTTTFAGASYNLPLNREPKSSNWGTEVSNFLISVAANAIPKTGGSYTLSAELNLGATYGVLAPYLKSATANIAAVGTLRLAKTNTVAWRNNANGADLALGINGSDLITFNSIALVDLSTSQTLTNKTLTSPTLTTPALGVATATSINGTSIPTSKTLVDTTNTLAVMAATTSAQLAGVISDETGSGALVFATSPTLTTPTIGVATATSVNKMAITAPATSSTLAVADGKTLTASNTLTMTATDGSTAAFGAGGTVAYKGTDLSQFAATTSLQLKGVISDETGSGALVFATSPALTTPDLGTPTAAVLTSATGLPLTTGVTGILGAANGGTGVANNAAATLTRSGNHGLTLTTTNTTSLTLPTSGTLAIVGGDLGTPSAAVLTNATGLPIGGGGTGQTTAAAAFKALAAYTAKGDLPGYSGSVAGILAVGADGTVLTADAASTNGIKWGTALTNPMTTAQDLIVGGSAGAATRMATPLLGDITAVSPSSQAYAVTSAAPGVFTVTAHGYLTGDKVYVTATQNGFTLNTTYYVNKTGANTFTLCTTLANAVAGTGITSSGTTAGIVVGGGLVLTSGVKGRIDGVAPTAGYVGEVITASLSTTTPTTTEADVTGASLALTPGRWLIMYAAEVEYVTSASSGDRGFVTVKITDNANALIGTSARNFFVKTVAAVVADSIGCVSAMEFVNISVATTYKLRAKRTDSAGTGIASVTGSDSTFSAVRLA